MPLSNRTRVLLLFLALYCFRTLFGLSLLFYGTTEVERDSLQTYLIGLKCYTTGTWPYFGPDQYLLTTGFHSQIPGALEGLAVGLPFYPLPIPEAPFLLLNLLSLSALALLARYITRRLPELSFGFVFAWIALLPWTLNRSTHILNPSFLLFGSVLFFIGFLECLPGFSRAWLSPAWAFGWMGFGLFWAMQFHLSWVLLPPLVLFGFAWRRWKKEGGWGKEALGFAGGAALPAVFLAPTFLKYGFASGPVGIVKVAQVFNLDNFLSFFTLLARYLSFPCFEMPRFLGSGTAERLDFLNHAPWLYPPALFLLLVGWLQPFALLLYGWGKDKRHPEGAFLRWLTFGCLAWIWVCFWFTSTGPAAHMYYLFLPLTVVYYFYLWSRVSAKPAWRRFAAACLVASLWFQTGFLVQRMKDRSLYTDRGRIVEALRQKNYRLLWERRKGSFY